MKRRGHTNTPPAAKPRQPSPPARMPGQALVIAAEMLAMSLVALPLSARAEEGPAPAIVSETATGQDSGHDLSQASQPTAEPTIAPEEISALLPLIVTQPEHKKLAARLEAFVKQGNMDAAQRQLDEAIEVGTLATILIDWLHRPGFLPALQSLGIQEADVSDGPAGAAEADNAPTSDGSGAATASQVEELRKALEQERAQAETSARDLAAATDQLNALKAGHEREATAAADKASELQTALAEQQARADAAARELASVTEQFNALKAQHEQEAASAANDTSGLQAAVKEQTERADASARQLAAVTEQRDTLKAEREREAAAAADKVAQLQTALSEQQARADAAAQELASLMGDFRNLKAERDQNAAAMGATIKDLTAALDRARDQGDTATRQLASVLDEFRALRGIKEKGPTPLIFRLERIGVPLPLMSADESGSGPAPAQPVATGALAPAAAPIETGTKVALASAAPEDGLVPAALPTARAPAPASNPVVRPAPPLSPADRLTLRADTLFRQGDISGARLLLERAQEAGSARASFILAETFDPRVLAERGVIGIRSDAARAQGLYRQALDRGIEEARARIEALK